MKNLIKKFIPSFLISWYHFGLAFLGAVLYGFPSRLRPAFTKVSAGKQGYGGQARKIIVIGVTGTKGKSTVVEFCHRIFQESGFQVASLSSIRFKINDKERPNLLKMTMPGRFKIQKFLREAVDAGCKYAILEVTSEGILQHRHEFINFEAAVFTNLSPEHIERHGGFENYRAAKGKLFRATKKIHVVNLDDENSKYFLKFPSNQKFCYSANNNLNIESLKIDWKLKIENWKFIKATDIKTSEDGINFIVDNARFHLNLLGGFNIYNALAAICVGLSQGISLETCKKAAEKIEGLPGRMEIVIREPFHVIVDYAHTPDALGAVYKTLTTNNYQLKTGRLICVLGSAGGGRDKWKRPKMGEIAAKYCDQIILTNEDPYDENPSQILSEIKSGIQNTRYKIQDTKIILDRRQAISEAIKTANVGDTVIVTGKGCEPWMCVAGGKKIPWDDREIVREEFRKLNL